MGKLKETKGITLIALIIAIIILLILAMVTIRILMNQGIIKHAQNATEAYNEAQNNELEYLTYTEGEMNKYAGADGSGSGDTTEQAPEDLQKYLLGVNLEGRGIFEVLDDTTMTFKDKDDEGSITSASTKVKLLNYLPYMQNTTIENGTVYAFYVKYNNVAYKVMTKGQTFTTDTTAGVVKMYEHTEGSKEGTIVHYSANGSATKTDWIVLYDNGNTLDIMSVNTMGSLVLGPETEEAPAYPNEEDYSDDQERYSEEYCKVRAHRGIKSYNNAISRLNDYCKSLITNSTAQKVRSVGSKPDFSTTDTTALYSSTNLATLYDGQYNSVAKTSDINAESDIIRMSFYDKAGSQFGYAVSNARFYLASRSIIEQSEEVSGGLFYQGDGESGTQVLWHVGSESADGSTSTNAVRPVVRVAADAVTE